MSTSASAKDYGQALTVRIWDNASAPHSNGIDTPETETEPNRLRNTSDAELYIFPADTSKATGQAVVICPGGGYGLLAIDHEGYEVAQWLAANGHHRRGAEIPHAQPPPRGAAGRCRTSPAHPARRRAGSRRLHLPQGRHRRILGRRPPRSDGFDDRQRPAGFLDLFYPVISAVRGKRHQGTFINLLSTERTPEQDATYSLENRVTEATPPTLLLLSDDDKSVPPVNSTCYYTALKEHGIEASMHIYPKGGHGWGIRKSFRYKEAWQDAVLDWLRRH